MVRVRFTIRLGVKVVMSSSVRVKTFLCIATVSVTGMVCLP